MAKRKISDKGGRPLKFETVAELRQKIQDYFDRCDPHTETRRVITGHNKEGVAVWDYREVLTDQQPYTINGLARALGTNRETINKYGSGDYDDKDDSDPQGERFSDAIKAAKARVAEDVEVRLLSGNAPAAGAIFWLKNNDGWKDKTEHELTSPDGLFREAELTVKVVDGRDHPQS